MLSCHSKCFAKVIVAISDEEMGQDGAIEKANLIEKVNALSNGLAGLKLANLLSAN